VINTSETLARRGHQVAVYTTRSVDYRTWANELPRREVLDGVQVRRFNSIRRRDWTWKLLDYGYINYRKRRAVRYHPFIMYGSGPIAPGLFLRMLTHGRRYDVVHINTLPYAHVWYAALAARMAGVPYVVTPFLHTDQADIFDVEWYNMAMRGADRVVVMTDTERDYLTQRFIQPERIVEGGVGIDPAEFMPESRGGWRAHFGIPEEAFVALFVGRRAPYKGLDVLLEAHKALLATHPDAVLVLAGPTTPYWEGLAPKYADLPGVIDLGKVSDGDKGRLLDACDVLVLPSTGESFGIVFVEAWTLGRPVIGARSGALVDMVQDGADGLLFNPGDVQDLVQSLIMMHDDPALRHRMGQKGLAKAVSQYTVEGVTDQIEALYYELAGVEAPQSVASQGGSE
jgi:glycosyltransferase involved in cell wall biosynthesis